MTTRRGRAVLASAAAVATLLVGAHVVAGNALGGFAGSVASTGNAAASGTLLYTESYGGRSCTSVPANGAITDGIATVGCAGSLLPATAAGTATTTITANGSLASSQVTQQVGVSSCAPLALANTRTPGDPLLVRNDTQFAPTGGPMSGTAGAITLDGTAPGDYESGTVSAAQPTGSGTYGLAVWFKTKSTAGGPLIGYGDSPANVAGSNDRILYLTAAGKIGFDYNLAGHSTAVSATSFNDGNWHLAYVTMQVLGPVPLRLGDRVRRRRAAGDRGGLFDSLSSYRGYWHAGWSPAVGGNPQQYFAGSLSNFTVFDNGSAPANLTVSSSQSAWDAQAATNNATEQWPMNDPATATATLSTYPAISGSPCGYVDIQWGFTAPTSCAAAPASTTSACTSTQSLASFAGSSATVASPGPGSTQTWVTTLSHDASWTGTAGSAFLSGLQLRVPVRLSMSVGTSAWSTTFSWTSTASQVQL